MPVDTRNKRAACLGFAGPFRGPVYPNPDGSLANQGDRQHVDYAYPGIAVEAPPAAEVPPITAATLDFDWLVERTLNFDHTTEATLDFDWLIERTLKF